MSYSDATYGGCTTQCKFSPYCGDGVKNGSEACDLGKRNGDTSLGKDGCTVGCTKPAYCGDGNVDANLGEESVKAGRWLAAGDTDAVVLNHAALSQAPSLRVGDRVALSLDGQPSTWRIVGIVEEIGSPAIAYVTDHAFAAITSTEGRARLLRIRTGAESASERTSAIRTIEAELLQRNVAVTSVVPLAELRTAIGDHIKLLVNALIAMAIILAVVGALGLGSAMGISVVERTREIGIMKAIGATPSRIVRLLLGEGLAISLLSWFLACALSLPLSYFVDSLIGNLGFLAPLPLVLSVTAAVGWGVLTLVVGNLATLVPARRASKLVIREALVHT